MPSEIRKVVRQIMTPMAVFVPCVALMAAAPAFAAHQRTSPDSSDGHPSAESTAAVPPPNNSIAAPAGNLKRVLIVGAEKAVATVNSTAFKHVSPGASVTAVLNNVPGFNARALGVGGFVVSGTAFTLDGFRSSELGTTFAGIPDLNTFAGGFFGNSDQAIGQPLVAMDVSGVHVYSGASTQADSSINDLGGTIAFEPALPGKRFGVKLGVTGGVYAAGGTEMVDHVSVNSGAIKSLHGLRVVAKFERMRVDGPWNNVIEHMNSYYFAAVQPTSSGHVKLIALVNAANGQTPNYVPAPILAQHGYDYNYPMNVSFQNQETQSTFVALSAKSLLNPRMIGDIKAFYVGTTNDRTSWVNPIYYNPSAGAVVYDGYSSDLSHALDNCSALNSFFSAPPYPEAYDCSAARQQFGSAEAGTAYHRYIQNYAEMGAMGHLTFLLPDNTVQVGASGFVAPMLSTESWYGSWPVAANKSGYNAAWLEHDGQTWMQTYIQDNIRLLNGKLHIYPGVKFTRLAMFSNDDQGYFYQHSGSITKIYKYIEDSIGVNYALTPELNAYVNWGQSTRAPAIGALYGQIGGQQPLPVTVKPETVDNIDAGFRFKNPYYYWDVAFFNRNFTNIFSSTFNVISGITLTTNAGNAIFRGGTIGGGVNLPYHLQLNGNAGYTHAVYTTNFTTTSGAAFTNGMRQPNVPVETANLDLAYNHGPWYGSLSEHYTGAEYLASYLTGVTTHYQLGGYGTLNLTGAYTWNVHARMLRSLKLTLHVDNLLNRHSPFYSPGIQTYDPALGYTGSNFEWLIYNTPLFASLNITASLD
jgi:hypothetical protein